MIQKDEVLTREENRTSFIATRGTTMQEDYPTITEREMPVNTMKQTWIFEAGEKARVGRTIPKSVNTFVKIMKWLSRVGSGKIDDSCLESRHNIHHNVRINGIGL